MLMFKQLPCPPFQSISYENTASCFQSGLSAELHVQIRWNHRIDLTSTSSNKWQINKQDRRCVFRQYMLVQCVFVHLYLHILWQNVTHHWFLVWNVEGCELCKCDKVIKSEGEPKRKSASVFTEIPPITTCTWFPFLWTKMPFSSIMDISTLVKTCPKCK